MVVLQGNKSSKELGIQGKKKKKQKKKKKKIRKERTREQEYNCLITFLNAYTISIVPYISFTI